MKKFAFTVLAILFSSIHYLSSVQFGNATDATECVLSQWYNGSVANGTEKIYHFNINIFSAIRIKTIRENSMAIKNAPLLMVARLHNGVNAWTVPLNAGGRGKRFPYYTVTETLCPALNGFGDKHSFYLDISADTKELVSYSFKAYAENDTLILKKGRHIDVNPAEPVFFTYQFTGDQERVLVKAMSESDICAVLMVQNSNCPSTNKESESSVYATMTTKAAITVERARITGDNFYVVVVVKSDDTDCRYTTGRINPFSRPDDVEELYMNNETNNTQNLLLQKSVILSVEPLPNISDYIGPVVLPVMFFGLFYVVAFIIFVVSWCMADDGGKSFLGYLFPSKVKVNPETQTEGENNQLLGAPQSSNSLYGTTVGSEIPDITSTGGDETDALLSGPRSSNSEPRDDEYDYLDDVDNNKDIYRLKTVLFLSDVSRKPYKRLSKKFNAYYWNLLTVSVFYALPVIQLVLTYQRVVNASGDQDICYYNFFCARPYHLVSAFNNIYSNIGYMMLGLLFIFLVMRRDRLSKQMYVKDPEREKKFGIPRHYGVMYAMGFALFMEGVMSSCYHVCPNYSNFQFDTAFMYMIGILACLRIYQCRHSDIFLNGHYAFTGLAMVIFTSVIGVIFRSRTFWIIFLIFHLSTCLYVSGQIYYLGRVKTAFKIHWLGTQRRLWLSAPIYKVRFVLLVIFNCVNWALSINGLVNIPTDFATYLLGIIICNGLLYVVFYVIMKIRNGEKIQIIPLASVILSVITWGVSITFFIQGLTNWQTSPAQSREGNKECRIFDFYDDHDLWHYLSAMALFFSFIAVLTIDDDLENKERDSIIVF